MMWHEFEQIAGYEVSYDDYKNIIEPMYMAIPEGISKAEFVKMINKKRFALPTKKEMINEMRDIAEIIQELCGHRSAYKEEEELNKLAKSYVKRFFGDLNTDSQLWMYFNKEYEYPELQRGCTYPVKLRIGRDNYEYECIELI